MRVPPGIKPSDFQAAVKKFQAAVGKEWVFTEDDDVDLYRDAYSPFWHEDGKEIVPSAAVAPDSTEEVQAVVRIANEYKIPIYPVSTGRNLGYGGSAPVLSGSVVLDLKRMNRVIEVNERNAYALVEPGVSYFDLYRYIQDKGYKLWIDCPDPGWGSPIGNALDHGAGFTVTPYRDHFDAHCGMEVVLANGEIVRTGMGALPGAKTWQQFKYGYGPFVDGIFSQSNFGVVTKMGFWLYPQPEAYREGIVNVIEARRYHPARRRHGQSDEFGDHEFIDALGLAVPFRGGARSQARGTVVAQRRRGQGTAERPCGGDEDPVLEQPAEILRTREGDRRSMGPCEGRVQGHSGRHLRRGRILAVPAHRRTDRQVP